eukprot:TRINITY_DN7795_c0_g2_i3.p1 TRINITY_DN7795_c0_g2~~TRINITY_DN7795_c0_g2_i3.p1  ORF type:complete len:877 (+),score=158.51 TRINITY_DN7795_c0_g2_i3:44-2674(+)
MGAALTDCSAACCATGADSQVSSLPKEQYEDAKNQGMDVPPAAMSGNARRPLAIWKHVRDSVRLWGDRGGGHCQPQPLFDAISALITVDSAAQELCGFHQASIHEGRNAKVDRAFVPFIESEVQSTLCKPGALSISARTPNDELGLKARLEEFIKGDICIQDPELLGAIHVQDIDWADVDNGAAALSLANCLKNSGAKHPLHTFVSERRFTSEFAPSVVLKDENGKPIKTEVMTDANGNPIQGMQFKVITTGDLSTYKVVPSVLPYVKEMEFEAQTHCNQDMVDLGGFECAILSTQLKRAGLTDTIVGRSGTFERAGLSGNVHKLTWYLYDHDGSVRSPEAYRTDADNYFQCGVGNAAMRRVRFKSYIAFRDGPLADAPEPVCMEAFFQYCRKHPEDKIVVHCGGPLFLLQRLAKEKDLCKRVILVGAMFLSYDGEANLLGMNFNEGVAVECAREVFGDDGKQIHRTFPNARVVCVTTETCKTPCLAFIPFQETEERMSRVSSLRLEAAIIPGKKMNQALLMISDDGKDPDDELAKVLLSTLTHRGLAECYGFIANLSPAKDRARLAKGTLNELGLHGVPVGVGHDMIASNGAKYEFDAPYMADASACEENGVALFAKILKGLDDETHVTVVCMSGLTDAWILLRDHRELFRKKVGRVVIMGGVEVEHGEVKLDANGYMLPDKANNNTFDFDAAQNLYLHLQKEGIPLTVVTRWAAYAAKVSFGLYDKMAATGHPVGKRLQKCQRHALEHLWRRVNMEADDPHREGLPGRCDKAWFSKVFLGGKGQDRNGEASIWDLASTFQAYDPVALLAALHSVRARFLRPLVVNICSSYGIDTEHEILGADEENSGVLEGVELSDWLQSALVLGLSQPKGSKH